MRSDDSLSGLRFGLCCIFHDEPIRFRTTTALALSRLTRSASLDKLSEICAHNAEALLQALIFCRDHGIGCFRVVSQILPLKTHTDYTYSMSDLPNGEEIVARFRAGGLFAAEHDIRTCFHPDQFVVLNSQRPEVIAASIRELEYQSEVAEWIHADVINVHGGGAFGDKRRALDDFRRTYENLSSEVRRRLTVENDDRIFTPLDLLPLCREIGMPLVYDVHHHRCHPDGLSVMEATLAAAETWNREPLFHLSSPAEGWQGPKPARHHDFIDPADFPDGWRGRQMTVEIEAKAKEAAILRLISDLQVRSDAGRPNGLD